MIKILKQFDRVFRDKIETVLFIITIIVITGITIAITIPMLVLNGLGIIEVNTNQIAPNYESFMTKIILCIEYIVRTEDDYKKVKKRLIKG
jgi:hypothetical protein